MFQIKNLEKSFDDVKVLKNINLEIKPNEKLVIIGPSGSGKSTLLRCLNGLEIPTKGEVLFEGKQINSNSYQQLHGDIGMVFQNFQLFEHMTVLKNLTLAPVLNKKMTKKQAKKQAMEYLKQIHLEDKKDVYPSELSGGQKQRIAIIRTLMMNPKVILFDEPTSALDPEMIGEVLSLIIEVAKKNITMIVVTHELHFAEQFASRVIFMDHGEILEEGDAKTLFSNPQTERLQQFLKNC